MMTAQKPSRPKKELRIAYSSIEPRVEFCDADWNEIESAGGKPLSAKHREWVRLFGYSFVTRHSADGNAIIAQSIEQKVESVIEHAEALKRALQLTSRYAKVDDWVASGICKKLLGDDYRRSHVPPVWHALDDLVRAAQATRTELISMTVERKPGPKHGATWKQFIRDMALVFEQAGGKTTIGTARVETGSRQGVTYERRSAFAEFVHAVYSVLARAEENHLPKKHLSAIGDYIKGALSGEKYSP